MNNHFRVSQKLGLMFLPDSPIPEDIKTWAVSQLHAESPVLGIKVARPYPRAKVKEWPKELQPDLLQRDDMFHTFKDNMERQRRKLKGHDTEADRSRNERDNLMRAYHEIFVGSDEQKSLDAAIAWSKWEAACSSIDYSPERVEEFSNPKFALAFALIENHYFMNAGF